MSFDSIPEELRKLRQWVCWREEIRETKNGPKPTKVPIIARSALGKRASPTDPNAWGPFAVAVQRLERGYKNPEIQPVNGIGFVFTSDDPYIGIDLDNPSDVEREIVTEIGSYAEWSPSGHGVHIIGRAVPPDPKGRHPKGIGVFSQERFFTMTGDVIGSMSEIIDIQDAIDHYWPLWFPERETPVAVAPRLVLDDRDILDKLRTADNEAKFAALYDAGSVSAYDGNESEADLALLSLMAFYTQDPGQLDRLFRSSALYRKKWERADYRDMTISRALERSEFYTPPLNGSGPTVYRSSRPVDAETDEKPPDIRVFNTTDLGNAQRLVHHAGDRLRYVPKWGIWLVWSGSRWAPDVLNGAMEVAKSVVSTIYEEAASIPNEKQAAKMRDWAVKSEGAQRLREMLNLAASDPEIAVAHDALDRDPMLLNVLNGTIDLRDGSLRPHRQGDMLTKIAQVVYTPNAECPTWERFLSEVMARRESLVSYLQRAVGYTLTGDVSERKMFILHGGGRNGKSTFLEVVREMLGDYAKRSPNDLMIARRGDRGIQNEIAELDGVRFTFVSETGEFDRLDESKVKDLVSGDAISARFLHQNLFQFTPQFKLWAGTNHKPTIRSTDDAIWERTNLIPFDVKIPEEQVDRTLSHTLRGEYPGILAWAVRGCLAWLQDGLAIPDVIRDETNSYRESMDTVGAFIAEECISQAGSHEPVSTMYAAYKEWSDANGERPWTKKRLTMSLNERGYASARFGYESTRVYKNIRLRTSMDDDPELDAPEDDTPSWMQEM